MKLTETFLESIGSYREKDDLTLICDACVVRPEWRKILGDSVDRIEFNLYDMSVRLFSYDEATNTFRHEKQFQILIDLTNELREYTPLI